jgi:hypothetical protein
MDEIKTLTATPRTKKLNYEDIRTKTVRLMDIKFAIAWAYKLNIHGEKLKDDDSVTVNGVSMTATDFLKKLSEQEGWAEYEARRKIGTQKLGSKEIVTVTRLARAFAPQVSKLIQKGIAKQSDDMLNIKKAADIELPDEFCFLNSPYGMSLETLNTHSADLMKFYVQFDIIIGKAVEKKWIEKKEGSKQRKWAEDFANYLQFRGADPLA